MILDALFYALAISALTFCVLRYFRLPVFLCFFVAALLLLATGLVVLLLEGGRHRKVKLNKKEREERDALMLHLALETPERVREALLSAYLANGKQANLKEDGIEVDGTLYLPIFTMQPISADAVARLLQKRQMQPFVLVCNELSPQSAALLSSFSVSAVCIDEVYTLFQKTECTPKKLICGNIPRRTAKTKLKLALKKSNARPFFVSGLALLFMSLFTVFPVYYLTVGGVLIATSIGVRLFGYSPA